MPANAPEIVFKDFWVELVTMVTHTGGDLCTVAVHNRSFKCAPHFKIKTSTIQILIFYSTYNLARLGQDKLIYG